MSWVSKPWPNMWRTTCCWNGCGPSASTMCRVTASPCRHRCPVWVRCRNALEYWPGADGIRCRRSRRKQVPEARVTVVWLDSLRRQRPGGYFTCREYGAGLPRAAVGAAVARTARPPPRRHSWPVVPLFRSRSPG
ncbi:hypothetical protein FKG94_18880 [Exilibacterium tricleocarpae]|uniref:Uncharacterized protein n=1 Tax=Exilibacterium tricleocarpae TaxID=2591008 RepID=A0A545T3C7_9GAMM|nr:hypothetical protein FKG94_18880 [Exilibacterium tricleocarpae]